VIHPYCRSALAKTGAELKATGTRITAAGAIYSRPTQKMMLVAASSKGLAVKITIQNQNVTNQNAASDEIRSDSISHRTDFFEARHQLMLEYREIDNIQEVTPPRVNGNSRHQPSIAPARLVEETLYWFLSAPALVYLIYLVVRPLIAIKP
jgi:hypothetical protein